jgi:gluconate 2-dehydrogenase gamma chain
LINFGGLSFGERGLPRRVVITGIPAALASAAVLGSAGCTSSAASSSGSGGASSSGAASTSAGAGGSGAAGQSLRFFSGHQGAVVEDATARIAPGPDDDPAEAGHPGAREAGVTGYIDGMLAALATLEAADASSGGPAPVIFAGGPWSNRHTSGADLMGSFIPLDPVSRIAWRNRLAGWQQQYTSGIALLDKLAGGDFTTATPADQDKILAQSEVRTFLDLLFEHTIEGMYSVPEYGGNRGLAGWKDISYPGDSQPLGYTPEEVERSDGRDPVEETSVLADVLKLLGAL